MNEVDVIEMNKFLTRDIHRGEIFYMHKVEGVGSEQRTTQSGRPVIVVSNEKANEVAPVVTVVCVTSQEKNPLPTHVEISDKDNIPIYGTILCETVQQCSKLRLGSYVGEVPDHIMRKIEEAICIQLAITKPISTKPASRAPEPQVIVKEVIKPDPDAEEEIRQLQIELLKAQEREKVFRELYLSTLNNGGGN